MYMQQSIVKCESGLYNRQATYFIQKANEFKSSIWIEVEERRINAKSLLGVLSMGITKGTRISLIAEGPDEEEAVNTLTEMLGVLGMFLDNAYLANLPTARIIHGKGTGILRAAVHAELRKCKYVKKFRLGTYGEGEDGVTIVEFA